MLTLFSTPRPFRGHFDTIQRNAIQSWMKLRPACQIILIDDEEGTTKSVAAEYGLECSGNIKTNEHGTMYLDEVFEKARGLAREDYLCHVNADIILMSDLLCEVSKIQFPLFYITGQRWNLDVVNQIDFEKSDWESSLRERVQMFGELHPSTGMDYWLFPKRWKFSMPPFLVGRPAVDNWFIQIARRARIPVIDGTSKITIVHQNHPRKHGDLAYEEETAWNRRQARGVRSRIDKNDYTFLLDDATYFLGLNGPEKKSFPWKRLTKYRDHPEILPGPLFFWKIIYSAYRLVRWAARWVYRKLKYSF